MDGLCAINYSQYGHQHATSDSLYRAYMSTVCMGVNGWRIPGS